MPNTVLFVGATIKAAQDCDQFFGPVKIPGSMTRQATIDNHHNKVLEARGEHKHADACAYAGSVLGNDQQYENRVHHPYLAVLASVAVHDVDGKTLYQQTATDPISRGKVAIPLLGFFRENYPRQFSASLRHGTDADADVLIFGFSIKQILRIAAAEVLGRNAEAPDTEQLPLPVRLWHNPTGVFDPLDILLPVGDRKELDVYSLLRFFKLEATPLEMATDASKLADVTRLLVERAQLA